MEPTPTKRTRELAFAIITVLVSVGVVWLMFVVWLMVSTLGDGNSATTTTATSAPPPPEATTTIATTTTLATTTLEPDPTTTVGVFDEVAAVEEFIEAFAGAIEAGDSDFLYERLHPAVKATYEEESCRSYIEENVLSLEAYSQEGPVIGPFDAEFGGFPITSYEAVVDVEIDGELIEETAMFSLTEGVVRWFTECS